MVIISAAFPFIWTLLNQTLYQLKGCKILNGTPFFSLNHDAGMVQIDARNLITWSSDLVWLSASLGLRRMNWERSPTHKTQNYMTWMNRVTTESKPRKNKMVADTATHSPTPPEALFWSPLTAQAPSHTPKRKCQQEDYMNRSSQLDYETEWRDMLLVLRWERIE